MCDEWSHKYPKTIIVNAATVSLKLSCGRKSSKDLWYHWISLQFGNYDPNGSIDKMKKLDIWSQQIRDKDPWDQIPAPSSHVVSHVCSIGMREDSQIWEKKTHTGLIKKYPTPFFFFCSKAIRLRCMIPCTDDVLLRRCASAHIFSASTSSSVTVQRCLYARAWRSGKPHVQLVQPASVSDMFWIILTFHILFNGIISPSRNSIYSIIISIIRLPSFKAEIVWEKVRPWEPINFRLRCLPM